MGEPEFEGVNIGRLRLSSTGLLIGKPYAGSDAAAFEGIMNQLVVTLDSDAEASQLMQCLGDGKFKATVRVDANDPDGIEVRLPKAGTYCVVAQGSSSSNIGDTTGNCDGTAGPRGLPECQSNDFGHPRLALFYSVDRQCTTPYAKCGEFIGDGGSIFVHDKASVFLKVADTSYTDNSGGFLVVVTNCSGSSLSKSERAVLLYKFENSLRDDSASANDLALQKGAVTYVHSQTTSLGYAISLDGASSLFALQPQIPPNDELSVAAWIRLKNTQSRGAIAQMRQNDTTISWSFSVQESRLQFVAFTSAIKDAPSLISKGELARSRWTHVAVTYNQHEAIIYIDGVEDSRQGLGVPISTFGYFIVGASTNPGVDVATSALNADLARIEVFNRVLLPIEVKERFNLLNERTQFVTAKSNARGQTATACDGEELRLYCDGTKVVSVLDANYGRTSTTVCSGIGSANTDACMKTDTFERIGNLCNSKSSCTILVNEGNLGASCGGPSYLQVTYSCVIADQGCDHIYFRGETPMLFAEAQDYCATHLGRLAVPDTQQKADNLQRFCDRDCGWIGLRCTDKSATCANDGNGEHWFWEDQLNARIHSASTGYTSWSAGAGPTSDRGRTESCAFYDADGKWSSDICRSDSPIQLMTASNQLAFGFATSHSFDGCLSCISDEYPISNRDEWAQRGVQVHCGQEKCTVIVDMRVPHIVVQGAVTGYPGDSWNNPTSFFYLDGSNDNNEFATTPDAGWRELAKVSASAWKSNFHLLSYSIPFEPFQIFSVSQPRAYRYYRIRAQGLNNGHMLIENLGLWGYKPQRMHRPLCERISAPLCSVKQKTSEYSSLGTNKECYTDSAAYRGAVDTYDGVNLCMPWTHSSIVPSSKSNSSLEVNFCRDPDATGKPWCFDSNGNKRVCQGIPQCIVDTVGFEIQDGVDYPGNDLTSIPNLGMVACAEACKARTDCNLFARVSTDSTCYLKGTRSPPVNKAIITTAFKRDAKNVVFMGWCGPDDSVLATSTYPDCISQCNLNNNCAAVRYVVNTTVCNLLSKCLQKNNDPNWRHWIAPFSRPCADINCNHGQCISQAPGTAVCACDPGFKGRFCEYQAWSTRWTPDLVSGANCMSINFLGNGFGPYENLASKYIKVIATLSHRNYNSSNGNSLTDSTSAHNIVTFWVEEILGDRFRVCFRDGGGYPASVKHRDLFVEWFATDLTSIFGGSGQAGTTQLTETAWGASQYCTAVTFREPFTQKPVILTTANRKSSFPAIKGVDGRPNGQAMLHGNGAFIMKNGKYTGFTTCVMDHSKETNHVHDKTYVDWLAVNPVDLSIQTHGAIASGVSLPGTIYWTLSDPYKLKLPFLPSFPDVKPGAVLAQFHHSSSDAFDPAVMWLENIEPTHAFAGFGEEKDLSHAAVDFDWLAFQ
eukprot:c52369_g1_i1.p1 GENE.c52369_g1_i1~~c52369_g1_i1.p1  ORF type:complete len:1410 (+),score=241.70 c52369_g1_i1:2-4231(+)